jgi:hypothetical protein
MKNLFLCVLLASALGYTEITDVRITHPQTKAQITRQIGATTPKEILIQYINYLKGVLGGTRRAYIDFQVGRGNATAASGYYGVTGVGTAGDTVTVAGTVLTAVNYASTATTAQFNIGSTVALTVAALNSAINGNSTIARYVTSAVSSTSVVLTAVEKGYASNFITTAENGTSINVGAATLSGGAAATANTYHYGY